jgi:hypothetical protein
LSGPGLTPGGFPELPIITPPVSARSQREKYGGLFFLGIAGLIVLVALLAWFAYGVWSHRDLWAEIYVLHDAKQPEIERVRAAYRLSRDDRLSDDARRDMALERTLPDLARYLLAESVSTEEVARDPRAFALAAARSPDWPDWLRLLWARRIAYGAARGYAIPREAVTELAQHSDPMIRVWAYYTFAVTPGSDATMAAELEKSAQAPGDAKALAGMLADDLTAPPASREKRLDQASQWLRTHHAQAAKIWEGWQIERGRVIRK